ncbi:MAG TPA: hypothetical protein GXX34_08140 [Clostridia bacterium]|nr:hypothetical protein [Clostridia bacterium]
MTPEELEARARERLVAQRQRTESMELSAGELYEIYQRMSKAIDGISSPVTLEDIWTTLVESEHLRSLGCEIIGQNGRQGLKISGVPGVAADVVLTISRELYEEGLADGTAKVHFASYGDPVFDAVLDYFSQYDLPTCITKLTVPVPQLEEVEVVALAAVCQESGGKRKAVLIRSWQDLKELQLAEGDRVHETELHELRQQLEREVNKEFNHYFGLQRIEKHNVRVAVAHEVVTLLVAKNLLEVRGHNAGKSPLFWPVLKEVEELVLERERILIDGLPTSILRTFSQELLFDYHVPSLGDVEAVPVPRIILTSACHVAGRLADSLKKKKSELSLVTVLGRINREVAVRMREV